ncbi:MAG: domain S-box protein [Segetibacter sp.]|jgi:PAS domain S-box-containing protein|nr:domain S-box protein [Segetibacter sp.]
MTNKIPEGTSNKQSGIAKKRTRAAKDTLHHLAFDHSLQPNIISSVSSGKIITANAAACKLLGYSKMELVNKSRTAIFSTKESSFKKMLKQRTAEGQSTALVTAVNKDGRILPCQITSAVFIENGAEKAITTIVDLSESMLKQKNIDTKKDKIIANNIVIAQTKSDVRLAENNEWIKYIARTSYDVMWDWDISTGEIYVGDSVVEVFGYKVENNTVNFRDLRRCLLPEEKDIVEKKLHEILASESKSWKDSFAFTRQDGSVAFTNCRASIVRDENRKAIRMIGALQDISKLQELENKLEEQKDIGHVPKDSLDVLWDWNLLTNEVCVGEGFEDLLGYTNQTDNDNIKDWRNYVHPDDKVATEKGLEHAIKSPDVNWQHAHRLKKADGSIARVFNRANIFRDDNEKAYRLVGIMQDITPQKENKSDAVRLIEDKKRKLTKKIKDVVLELIYHSHEKLQTNFSDYLSTVLQYDYTYLANLFSEVEGVSIQQYIITQKIERVKELIETNELTLTQIARKLQYSSVAHLSNQFKKFTGLTPTEFKLNSN